jgi:cytochrome c oxidase subunit II
MFTDVPLLPEQATDYAGRVDTLFFFLLGITLFFTVLITVLITVFSIRYRRRSPDETPPLLKESIWLEITWSLIPLFVSLIIFYWAADLYFHGSRPPDDSLEVFMVGRQWMWKAQHVGGQREINDLHVPLGRPVKVTLTSQDVIHSFFVPAFRLHKDVLPDRYTTIWFHATKPGSYHLFCSQYCGTDHSRMVGKVVVMEPEDYEAWLLQGGESSMYTEGRKLFQKLECVGCHSANAQAKAPVLEGLFGRRVELRDGRGIKADEAYFRESILYPDAKVAAGYQPIMPSYVGQLDEEEMLQLIVFLKGLGPGQTPPRVEQSEPAQWTPPAKKQRKGN